jgi:LEA14-like dessication related protein
MRPYALATIALVASCSRPDPPTLVPEQVTVTSVDMQGLGVNVAMSVTNPNSVDLSVSGITSHIVLDRTHDVGTVTLPEAITLPAGKTTKLDLPVALKWSDIGVLAGIAATANAVPYSVDGTLNLGGNLLHVGVPFHLEGSIPHDQLVGATLKSLPKIPW